MSELIRKQDAIKAICEDGTWLERQGCTEITMVERKQRDVDIIENLPTVQPNTGHWGDYLPDGLRWKCSECGSRFETPYNFCPHCGARMER